MKTNKLIISAVFLCALTTQSFADIISGSLNFDASKIETREINEYDGVSYSDGTLSYVKEPGNPFVPKYSLSVLLPKGAKITKVSISNEEMEKISDNFDIYPAQAAYNKTVKAFSFTKPDEDIYGQNALFPYGNTVNFESVSKIRGYTIANLLVNFVKVNPVSRELFLVKSLDYTVEYEMVESVRSEVPLPLNAMFDNLVKSIVANPADMAQYSTRESMESTNGIDMLIITNEDLRTAYTYYASGRQYKEGIVSVIKTVEEIATEYATQPTVQLQIKQCIIDHVQNNNITYVLLGGDETVIPDQDCYVQVHPNGLEDNTIPTDLFYACIDGQIDWNENGNDKIGEPEDNPDVSPDVFIGRLTLTTDEGVDKYNQKIDAYYDRARMDKDYANRLLLCGARIVNQTDGMLQSESMYSDFIAPYWTNNDKHTLYAQPEPHTILNAENLTAEFAEGNNLMHITTHGSSTVWALENGYYSTTDVDNLPDGAGAGFVVGTACLTAQFDNSFPSLAESFVNNQNAGSIVYIGASRIGWAYPDGWHGHNQQYADHFFKYILDQSAIDYAPQSGAAFGKTKVLMSAQAVNDGFFRWVHYSLNFFGDPSTKFVSASNENIALSKTAYASSCYSEPQYSASNAVDGNKATAWGSATNGNEHIYVDLGSHETIHTVNVNWLAPYFGREYRLYTSDDAVNWDRRGEYINLHGGSHKITLPEGVSCRYVGIYCMDANDIVYGISELKVFREEVK